MTAEAHEFRRTESLSGRASSRKVKELLHDMKKNGWIGSPIAVAEYRGEKYILNGHHRTYAARLAGIEVYYRVVAHEELPAFGYDSIVKVVQTHAEAGVNRIVIR